MKKLLVTMILCVVALIAFVKIGKRMFPTSEAIVPQENIDLPNADNEPTSQPLRSDWFQMEEKEFTTGWLNYLSDGQASFSSTMDTQTVALQATGSTPYSVQLYYQGLQLEHQQRYIVEMDVESSLDRSFQVALQNGDGSVSYGQKWVQPGHVEMAVTMQGDDGYARLVLNLGCGESGQGFDAHTMTFKNISIRQVNKQGQAIQDGKRIRINQLGYKPNSTKRAVFVGAQGDYFEVVNADSGEAVYRGVLTLPTLDENSKEENAVGDFSAVTTAGRYYLRSSMMGTSATFEIKENAYSDLLTATLKFFTYQRCGHELTADQVGHFAHAACHYKEAATLNGEYLNVIGGWHDAGDYGRYVQTGSKAVMDLMLAYNLNPMIFSDHMGIQNGNEVPDILDEARIELDWLLKMQNAWGGVYEKVVTPSFAGIILPQEDDQLLYIIDENSIATADFVGVMAYAYSTYQDIDPVFAQACLDAAIKSYEYLQGMAFTAVKNPPDFQCGLYNDDSDLDQRFFASAAMFHATGEQRYAEDIAKMDLSQLSGSGLGYEDVSGYGIYLYLTSPQVNKSDFVYKTLFEKMMSQAERMIQTSQNAGYRISLESFVWGSNRDVANSALYLLLTHEIEPSQILVDYAQEHFDYLLGKNAVNMSFVTGFGLRSPHNPHHRMTMVLDRPIDGMLVGGVDSSLEDEVTIATFNENTPVLLRYVDHENSYSTNEIAVYWNSPLVATLSALLK